MIIIANPRAGHGRGAQTLSQVEAYLSDRHIVHQTAVSERPGHVTDIAAEAAARGQSPMVLVGGDGTLFEAVNGMARAGRFVPVAQIPIGTGNSFIKDLGIESVEDGLRALTGGRTRAVDVGRVRSAAGEYHFVNLVGAGFVANVAARAAAFKLFGDLSYKIGVMLELVVLKAAPCRLTVDGKESVRDALFVEVCNSRKTGGEMIMAPSAEVDDGLFDVVVARAMSRANPPEALSPHLHGRAREGPARRGPARFADLGELRASPAGDPRRGDPRHDAAGHRGRAPCAGGLQPLSRGPGERGTLDDTGSAEQDPIIRLKDVKVRFGNIISLDGVDFEVGRHEVVGLLGNNGAGKSTLIKTLLGFHPRTSGEVFLEGRQVNFRSPREARAAGIETVFQDFSLAEGLSVVQNFFIGRELSRGGAGLGLQETGRMEKTAEEVLRELGLKRPVTMQSTVSSLSGGSGSSSRSDGPCSSCARS